jgi:hypothetical protein
VDAAGRLRSAFVCLAVAALAAALATACGGEEEAAPATPTAAVTPAVTPTPTRVATPTATATPTRTAVPTPAPTRAPSPTAVATPTLVAVPAQPGDFADYPAAIASYLTEMGGSPSCLAELFAAWDMPDGQVGPRCAAGDLDGDGEEEYVVRITVPSTRGTLSYGSPYEPTGEPISYVGDILILDKRAGHYELVYGLIYEGIQWGHEVTPESFPFDPTILGVEDYNGDGKLEVALTTADCGAHTCSTSLYILAWDGTQYRNLFEQQVIAPWTSPSEIDFVDLDGDGVKEVRLPVGQIASVGAGPQRDRVEFYAWDGTNYVLVKAEYEPSDFLYFAVTDADAAYAAGDVETAIALYRKAIEDTSLVDWHELLGEPEPQERDRDELIPYAHFRLYLAQLASLPPDDAAAAQDLVDSIAGLLAEFPNSFHAYAAWQFAQAYPDREVSSQALSQGCAAFLAVVEDNRQEFDDIWYYGYANPDLVPERLCPY